MPTIYESVTAKAIAARYEERPREGKPFLLGAFFPAQKQYSTTMEYIKGAKGVVRPLSLSSYDAKAIPIGREGFEKLSEEMPFFKNSMNINEKMRKDLLNVLNSGNAEMIELILNKIFDDKGRLLANGEMALEQMRAQALTTGALNFSANGQTVSFNYQVPEGNKHSLDWSDPKTADPITDLSDIAEKTEIAYGVKPTVLVMNSETFRQFKNIDSIKNAIYVMSNGTVTPNNKSIQNHIETETGMEIYLYNKGYYDAQDKWNKFIPDNKIILFPDMAMGNTVFAPTPAETDLMTTDLVEDIAIVNNIALYTAKHVDPVTVETFAAMCAMVSMENANYLNIIDINGSL